MGLLKTGFKAAVAVKTADLIHERVLARQEQHAAAHGHPEPTAAAAAPVGAAPDDPARSSPDMGDTLAQLQQLGNLRDSGVLTDAEFEAQKARILGA